jgi:asparagine synthase (glutamine-hydrolysing)
MDEPMCGVVAMWQRAPRDSISRPLLMQMTSILRHRGPDDEGYLCVDTQVGRYDEYRGRDTLPAIALPDIRVPGTTGYDLAFGFRRLSIIDLTAAGHQPMGNSDRSLWIIFNGEIYNYRELRDELEAKGHRLQTATDTEVLLYSYQEWGEACLEHLNGMWGFALWDGRRNRLFCARDRLGIKPLYYYWDGRTFALASEIKALLPIPALTRRANDGLVYDYLTYGFVDHTEETFFVGIRQLPAAHWLSLDGAGDLRLRRYWDLDREQRAAPERCGGDYEKRFYTLFEDAVRLHLRSDVPVGTCLSGGLDSSAIVCVANRLLHREQAMPDGLVATRQKTFSSCFDDQRYDEREYIAAVIALTGAEPNYTFPQGGELPQVAQQLIWHQDEPFGSTSIYAQWCVMQRAANRGIKVLLDGQGADELLAGYPGYFDYQWSSLFRQRRWTELWRELDAYRRLYTASPVHLAARLLRLLAPAGARAVARHLRRGSVLGLDPQFAQAYHNRVYLVAEQERDPFDSALYTILVRFGLPALLRYEDRNAMAHSVESRVPFLDYRLVEYVFSLPADQKIRDGRTKAVLRHALKDVLPETVRLRRDKMGFVTPERQWMSHELRGWVREIFASDRFRTRGYCDAGPALAAFDAHAAGKIDLNFLAWRWVNLELWCRAMIDRS